MGESYLHTYHCSLPLNKVTGLTNHLVNMISQHQSLIQFGYLEVKVTGGGAGKKRFHQEINR